MFEKVKHVYPKVNKQSFVDWNEEMFKKYDNERVYNHVNPVIRFIERKRVGFVLDFLHPVYRNSKILAAGCGEGYIEAKIPDGELYLVDISEEAISRAQKKLGNSKRFHFYQTGLEDLPFGEEFFDRIECSEVLEHVLSPGKVISEMARVLKSDGLMAISFPNEPLINGLKNWLVKIGIFNYFFPNVPRNMLEEWHLHAFSRELFEEYAKESLEVVEVKGAPFFWLPIRYVVQCRKRLVTTRPSASLQKRVRSKKVKQ